MEVLESEQRDAKMEYGIVSSIRKKGDTTTPDEAAPTDEGDVDADADAGEPADAEEEPAEVALDPGTFEEAVNEHMDDIGECYGTANAANPELKGEMNTMFTIDADGKVAEFKVQEGSTLNDEGLTQCIVEKSKGWQFPKPASGEGSRDMIGFLGSISS